MNRFQERTLALAGVFQAVQGVHEIARDGQTREAVVETAVRSILNTDAEDTAAIFDGTHRVRDGLDLFRRMITQQVPADHMAMTRYAVGTMHLAKKLVRDPNLLDHLSQGIDKARSQVEAFGPTHENVLASLADLYSQTAGTIQPRIMVSGDDSHLQNPSNVNAIRTLLLGAVRSAVLWHQLGGNRLNLIFRRGALAREATRLMEETAS